jgi:hypothetical protein
MSKTARYALLGVFGALLLAGAGWLALKGERAGLASVLIAFAAAGLGLVLERRCGCRGRRSSGIW